MMFMMVVCGLLKYPVIQNKDFDPEVAQQFFLVCLFDGKENLFFLPIFTFQIFIHYFFKLQ